MVLVIWAELGENALIKYGGSIDSINSKRYYGYADLKGNDTFSNEIKQRCKESKERALKNM